MGPNYPLPERRVSCCRRLFFLWFTPLMALGARRPLMEGDMWHTPPEDECRTLSERFSRYLASVRRRRPNTRRSVLWALLNVRLPEFCLCAFLKLIGESMDFAGPVLLGQMLRYVEKPDDFPDWHPFVLAAGMFLLSVCRMLIMMNYVHLTQTIGTSRAVALTGMIYRKALHIRAGQFGGSSTGQITTLMSNDCERIKQGSALFQNFWCVTW